MYRVLFALYYLIALGIGGGLGYANWGGLAGLAGGLFLGALIGTALFYCFAIALAFLPSRKRGGDSSVDADERVAD